MSPSSAFNESDSIDLILYHKGLEGLEDWVKKPKTPAELLIEAEDAGEIDKVQQLLFQARLEVVRKFCEELFCQGRNPGRVCRNLYTYVAVLFPDILGDLRGWEVADILFSDTRAAQCARVKHLKGRLNGGKGRTYSQWRARCERSRAVSVAAQLSAEVTKPWERKRGKFGKKIKGKKRKQSPQLQFEFRPKKVEQGELFDELESGAVGGDADGKPKSEGGEA
jgi:hypothetical protein